MLLIGHDMDLMAQVVDRVGIMYAGNFAEVANVGDLFSKPLHPYSQMLIARTVIRIDAHWVISSEYKVG